MEEEFNKYFYYDETSPSCLRWKVERRGGKGVGRVLCSPGDVAGSVEKAGYFVVGINYKVYKVHRIIWQLVNGPISPSFQIDHIDRNKKNNSIQNLRCVENAINSRNRTINPRNTSGHNGVMLANLRGYLYWRASWHCVKLGRRVSKSFRILTYGYQTAFDLAVSYREKMISLQNSFGAGYTEDHGQQKAHVL